MTFFAIALLCMVVLYLRFHAARGKQAGLISQSLRLAAIETEPWEPAPDADPDLSDDMPADRAADSTHRLMLTDPPPAHPRMAAFYRTVYGPGLCSAQPTDDQP